MPKNKPLILTILDGWGYAPASAGNAISIARKPNYDRLLAEFPNTLLHASDHFVGLPDGQMGNSEVGHLNIGAGRIVQMDIVRIDELIRTGDFFAHPVLKAAMQRAARTGRQLHFLGLLSDGGVHSHQRHLYALLDMAKREAVKDVLIHAFLDGRDTLPTSSPVFLQQLIGKMDETGVGKIASVSGRYYAMDRDRKWDRELKAFDAMVKGRAEGGAYADPIARVKELASNGITDEFVIPFVCCDPHGHPVGTIKEDDVCICFNFRADRARQITRALTRNSGLTANGGRELDSAAALDEAIPLLDVPRNLHYVTMTQYDKHFTLPMVIPSQSMENLLANIMGEAQLRNLRVAETEKYAHVTYFFNGGVEKPFAGEERELIPSQKVATYDLAPEMSASGIADAVIRAVSDTAFDVVVVNFANADMVAHSGRIEPTVRGIEIVDACLGRIYQAIKQQGGSMLITADHGNAEQMIDPGTGGVHTAHTTNPVPLILLAEDTTKLRLAPGGSLQDISPTVLHLLQIPQPKQMTGKSLIVS